MTFCMLYMTVGTPGEARKIATALVSERLVACVNVINNAVSIYRWEEKIQEDPECILVAKTTVEQRDVAIKRAEEIHSYETPCIVSYDIADGSKDYLDWLSAETTQT